MLKIPPYSLEAEQSVIGSLIIDRDSFILIWDLLVPDDFYSDSNKIIFEVILDLFKNSKPIDLLTVKERLDDKKMLDKIWWITYLTRK